MVALHEGIVTINDGGVSVDPVVSKDNANECVEAMAGTTKDSKEADGQLKETEKVALANNGQKKVERMIESGHGETSERGANQTTTAAVIAPESKTGTTVVPKQDGEETKVRETLTRTRNEEKTSTVTVSHFTVSTTATTPTESDTWEKAEKQFRRKKRMSERIKNKMSRLLDGMVEFDKVAKREKRDVLYDLLEVVFEGKVCGGANDAAAVIEQERAWDFQVAYADGSQQRPKTDDIPDASFEDHDDTKCDGGDEDRVSGMTIRVENRDEEEDKNLQKEEEEKSNAENAAASSFPRRFTTTGRDQTKKIETNGTESTLPNEEKGEKKETVEIVLGKSKNFNWFLDSCFESTVINMCHNIVIVV